MNTHPRLRSTRTVILALSARSLAGVLVVVTGSSAALLIGDARPAAAQGYGWFGNLFGGSRPQPQPPSYPGSGYPTYPRQGYARPGTSGQTYPGQSYSGRSYPGQTYPGQGYTGQGYAAPPSRDYGSSTYDQPRRRPPRRRQVEQAQKEAPPKEKVPPKNASLFVDVFGDSLGQMLGNGLDDAFSDRQDVAIVHKARASTGLVATDTFDWPKAIADMLSAKSDGKSSDGKSEAKGDGKLDDKAKKPDEKRPDDKKIDVAVMMIGTNDRQPIHENGATLAPGTPEWGAAYRKRVAAIDEAFRRHGVPLVWVGVPITKDDAFADDMAAFNDIYREEAAKSGATYVDTWEAFSDEDGDFSSYGPDVNGQTVRLRAPDGVLFTRAGERKLAHFVETHVRRDLDGKVPTPQLPTDAPATAAAPGGKPAVAAVKPEAGPIKSLTDAPAASNGQLSSVATYRDIANRDSVLQSALVRGEAASALAGRADDMRWSADSKAN